MISHTERRSAYAKVVALQKHPIPRMVDPLGANWDQPNRLEIEVDKTHALMSRRTFEKLHEYSCSQPSGVYPGKMWRRNNGVFDHAFIRAGGKPVWWLCWFDYSEQGAEWCTTRHRVIVLSDADIDKVKES